MAQNSFAINIALSFFVIFLLSNLRFNIYIKILLMPALSICAGLISSLLYESDPGSFAVFLSSSFIILILVGILYPMTRKFFQGKKIKAEEKLKAEGKS